TPKPPAVQPARISGTISWHSIMPVRISVWGIQARKHACQLLARRR
ncbi:MAG: hypothetical protein IMZ43_10630, partial [Thermoplasmata archaeon]|nr:hypothetical protein [Thermoplasmata archaeon]